MKGWIEWNEWTINIRQEKKLSDGQFILWKGMNGNSLQKSRDKMHSFMYGMKERRQVICPEPSGYCYANNET